MSTLGCHGVNTNTEHRHREKKKKTVSPSGPKILLCTKLHLRRNTTGCILYLMKLQIALCVYCRSGISTRVDSQETPVKFMYRKSTWDLWWKCCLSTRSAHQFNTCDRENTTSSGFATKQINRLINNNF